MGLFGGALLIKVASQRQAAEAVGYGHPLGVAACLLNGLANAVSPGIEICGMPACLVHAARAAVLRLQPRLPMAFFAVVQARNDQHTGRQLIQVGDQGDDAGMHGGGSI